MQVSAELDESVQTAQDYAISVDDPGEEDLDPDEVRSMTDLSRSLFALRRASRREVPHLLSPHAVV